MSNNNKINESNLKPIDNLVLKSFIGKFNEKYSDDLLSEQKLLLSHYISSFSDNGLQLKMFLNEELGRLKSELKNSLNLKEIYSDAAMFEKVEKLIEKLNSFYEVDINESMLKQILKTQNLVKGINE